MERNLVIKLIGLLCVLFLCFFVIKQFNNKKDNEIEYLTYQDEGNLILKLNGNYIEYVEINEEYEEKNIIATANGLPQNDISVHYYKNNKAYSFIDTSNLTHYLVTYTVVNPFDKEEVKSINRVVIIRDSKKPKITVPKTTTISVNEVDNFDLEDEVSVSDNSGVASLTYENTLQKAKGTYIITYTATDKSNNTTTKQRMIKVVE